MDSIITNYTDYCIICGRTRTDMHHCIGGTANRAVSDKYNALLPLCRDHHEGNDSVHRHQGMMVMSKIIGQLAVERQLVSEGMTLDEARAQFIKDFGKSYI